MGGSSFTDFSTKDELPQEGILFCTQSSSLGIFINKKVLLKKFPGKEIECSLAAVIQLYM